MSVPVVTETHCVFYNYLLLLCSIVAVVIYILYLKLPQITQMLAHEVHIHLHLR
jgi:hypothetical protein